MPRKMPPAKPANTLKANAKLAKLLRGAAEATSKEDGWAELEAVGSSVKKQSPDFDSKRHGYAKFHDLSQTTGLFEIQKRSLGEGIPKSLCIRARKCKAACGDKSDKTVEK